MKVEARMALRRNEFALDVDFSIESGETVALLGPNGAGKSTVVEVLAGLVGLDAGEVRVGDEVWEVPDRRVRLAPQARSVGVMFQGLLLFPALGVLDNVAFGLRARGMRRDDARRAAGDALERLGVADLAQRRPSTLSSGQAQRVALARALVVEPDLLLLDEPMSALDVAKRAEARRVLAEALRSFDGAKLMVTHEPLEAMALADRLIIIEDGAIVQTGTPAEVRERPRSTYTASLVGLNLLRGSLHVRRGHAVVATSDGELIVAADVAEEGKQVLATVHPRAIILSTAPPSGSARNVLEASVLEVDLEGDRARVLLDSRPRLTAEITIDALEELGLAKRNSVWAAVKATSIEVYPA